MEFEQRFSLRERAYRLVDDFVGTIETLSKDVATLKNYKNQNGVIIVEEAAWEINHMIIRQVRGDARNPLPVGTLREIMTKDEYAQKWGNLKAEIGWTNDMEDIHNLLKQSPTKWCRAKVHLLKMYVADQEFLQWLHEQKGVSSQCASKIVEIMEKLAKIEHKLD